MFEWHSQQRQAYTWLKDNTPEDARIMAWWDYGYQIAGLANRTTIADGNTWNLVSNCVILCPSVNRFVVVCNVVLDTSA